MLFFCSAMMGMTRFLVSENDFKLFCSEQTDIMDSIGIYTDDTEFMDKFYNLDLQTIMNIDYSGIKRMYIMDMLIAAVVLIVSICLILISMVILHFTINFTMSEEFREIGVMKSYWNYKQQNQRALHSKISCNICHWRFDRTCTQLSVQQTPDRKCFSKYHYF